MEKHSSQAINEEENIMFEKTQKVSKELGKNNQPISSRKSQPQKILCRPKKENFDP